MTIAFLDENVMFKEPSIWLYGERTFQTEETSREKALRGQCI